jgi:hypothetical protein
MCPVTGCICALILLYMCLSYCYICVLIPSYYICVSHRRPHTTIYVSSCRLHMRPHTTIYVSLILLYCVFLQATYTPSYYYIYVFHTTVYVSSFRLHIRSLQNWPQDLSSRIIFPNYFYPTLAPMHCNRKTRWLSVLVNFSLLESPIKKRI